MFEFHSIFRYIIPKKGEITSSLISLLSLIIITLVTWLTLVFLSVADGIEKGWVQKLTSIHGKVKIVPNQNYYDSHYYRVDAYKFSSDYKTKSLKEKKEFQGDLLLVHDLDEELPDDFPLIELNDSKKAIDLVKESFSSIEEIKKEFPNVSGTLYEIAPTMMRLKIFDSRSQNFHLISQAAYAMSSEHLFEGVFIDPVIQKTSYIPIYLPKSFSNVGAKVHDVGQFVVCNPFSVGSHEEIIPFEVVGFYKSGSLQIGPKCVFSSYENVMKLKHSMMNEALDPILNQGITLDFNEDYDTAKIVINLKTHFEKKQIQKYFDIIPYYEYSFVKDILLSFKSDRVLYSIVSLLVLAVAASNIICVLLMIVFQSRQQIALYTALGASKKTIVKIFSGMGFFLSTIGAFLGLILAHITMRYLNQILSMVEMFEGYQNLFSDAIPSSLSIFSIQIVLIGAPLLGLFAGFFPALKASRLNPSELLRST